MLTGTGDAVGDVLSAAFVVDLSTTSTVVIEGGIEAPDDVDLFSVTLSAGQLLRVDIDARVNGSPLDSFVRVFDAQGNELAVNDDSDGTDSGLDFLSDVDGVFFVGVSSFGNGDYDPVVEGTAEEGTSSGDFTLGLEVISPTSDTVGDTLTEAEVVELSESAPVVLEGLIDDPADVDLFAVTLAAGQVLRVDIDAQINESPLDSFIRVFDAAGHEIAFNDDSDGRDSELTFVAQSDGVFFIGVTSFGNSEYDPTTAGTATPGDSFGAFQLILEVGTADTVGDVLEEAAVVDLQGVDAVVLDAAIDTGDDVDVYAVALTAGQVVRIDIDAQAIGSDLDSFVRVFDAAGNELAFNDDSDRRDSGLFFVAEADGVFFIGVSSFGNSDYDPTVEGSAETGSSIGAFRLSLQRFGPDLIGDRLSEAWPVQFPASGPVVVNGAIDSPDDVDLIAVSLAAGQALWIDVDGQTIGSGVDSLVRVFDATGREVAFNDNFDGRDSGATFVAPSNGVFFVGVSSAGNASYDPVTGAADPTGATLGDFRITLLVSQAGEQESNDGLEGANRLVPGAAIRGTLSSATDRDVYEILITDPASFRAWLSAVDASTNVEIQLRDATGRLVASSIGASGSQSPELRGTFAEGVYFIVLQSRSFTEPITYTLSASAASLSDGAVGDYVDFLDSADVNGDGRSDLVALDNASNEVSVLLGNGDGTFQTRQVFAVGLDPRRLQVADVDGDGRLDIVAVNAGSDDVSVLLGNGDGTFQNQIAFAAGSRPRRVQLADFNDDGRMDLVTINLDSDDVSVLLGNGDGTFLDQQTFQTGSAPEEFQIVDVNGDGRLDLVVANYGSDDVSVLLGRGNGEFDDQVLFEVGDSPDDLRVVDLNGDGRLDVVAVNYGSDDVSVLLGQGAGAFEDQQRLGAGYGPFELQVVDLNGDDRPDLVLLDEQDLVNVLLNQGDGTFGDAELLTVGIEVRGLAVGDVTGDGNPDLVTANYFSYDVSVLVGNGDGTFRPDRRVTVGQGACGIRLVDADGDGCLDIVTANARDDDFSVVLANGDGSFPQPTLFESGDAPFFLRVGDVNGDGRPDLITANFRSNDVSILLANGDGTFQTQQVLETAWPGALEAVDLNRDGRLDLVVVNEVDGGVSVFIGNGDGTFQAGETLATGSRPTALVVQDVNADERLDLIIANRDSNSVSVLLGQGDGTFQEQREAATGLGPWALQVLDVNRDGRLDLVTINRDSNDLSVLLGQGDGTFQPEARFDVGTDPLAFQVADVNGDGRLDLLTANYRSDDVSVLLGRGDGTFEDQLNLAVGVEPNELQVVDVNGDGAVDVVTANYAGGTVSVLLGLGDGRFHPQLVLEVSGAPERLQIVDVNADGRLDVITANRGSNDVSVLLGSGDGGFLPQRRFNLDDDPLDLQVADINLDGIPDLVTSGFAGRTGVLLGDGLGSFDDSADQAGGSSIGQTITADADFDLLPDAFALGADGKLVLRFASSSGGFSTPTVLNPSARSILSDFVVIPGFFGSTVIGANRIEGRLEVLRLGADGERVAARNIFLPDGVIPSVIERGDVNGDFISDLVVLDTANDELLILIGGLDGSFTLQAARLPLGFGPSDLQLTDVDGRDGLDIVVGNRASGDVSVYVNDGTGNFTESRFRATDGLLAGEVDPNGVLRFRTLDQLETFVVGDFSGDGVADLVVTAVNGLSLSFVEGAPGGGFFNPSGDPVVQLPGSPTVLRAGDVNGDGRLDVVMLIPELDQVAVCLGRGGGKFRDAVLLDAGFDPRDVALTDATLDGRLDIVVGNDFGDLLILKGQGDGRFESLQDQLRAQGGVPIAVADLDGDGVADDVVLSSRSQDVLQVQLNADASQRTFEQGASANLIAPGGVTLADVDGDGRQDLLVANGGANTVVIYKGGTNGQFAKAGEFVVGTNPTAVTARDLNGDGRSDLVVANQGSNDVSVLFNSTAAGSPLSFTNGPRLAANSGPASVDVLDGNSDGVLDIVVTSATAGTVALLPGVGGGFFNDAAATSIDVGQTSLQGATIQGNSLVVTNPGTNSVTVISDLSGAFQAANPQLFVESFSSGGQTPTDAAFADYDADGTLDLIVANGGDGTIALLNGANGFALDDTLSDPNLLNPSALAVVDTGEGINILVTDEGSEIVTAFDVQSESDDDVGGTLNNDPVGVPGSSTGGELTLVSFTKSAAARTDAGARIDAILRDAEGGDGTPDELTRLALQTQAAARKVHGSVVETIRQLGQSLRQPWSRSVVEQGVRHVLRQAPQWLLGPGAGLLTDALWRLSTPPAETPAASPAPDAAPPGAARVILDGPVALHAPSSHTAPAAAEVPALVAAPRLDAATGDPTAAVLLLTVTAVAAQAAPRDAGIDEPKHSRDTVSG